MSKYPTYITGPYIPALRKSIRPITEDELIYYSYLRENYEERVKQFPDRPFLKYWLNGIKKILRTNVIVVKDEGAFSAN